MNGWISLHRKILDNPVVCKDSDYFAVWVYLILTATHEGMYKLFKKEKILLNPGELITSRKSISSKLKIQESKIERILKAFESEQQIEQQTSNACRLVKLVNYAEYQNIKQQDEQRMNNERTTDEQRMNTHNKGIRNNKEIREQSFEPKGSCPEPEKSAPKKPKKSQPDEIPQNLQTPEFLEVWEEWKQHRREKKQTLTDTTKKKQLKSFSEVGPDVAVMAISDSIEKGYTGVFVKNFTGQNSTKTNKKPETPKGEPIKTEPLYNPFTDPNFGKGTVIPKNTIELKDGEYERL